MASLPAAATATRRDLRRAGPVPDGHRAAGADLGVRHEDLGPPGAAEAFGARRSHHADDLRFERPPRHLHRQPLQQRVRLRPVPPRQCLVDHGDARPLGIVPLVEAPAGAQRDAHRIEVAGGHLRDGRGGLLARGRRRPIADRERRLDREVGQPQRERRDGPGGGDARQRPDPAGTSGRLERARTPRCGAAESNRRPRGGTDDDGVLEQAEFDSVHDRRTHAGAASTLTT